MILFRSLTRTRICHLLRRSRTVRCRRSRRSRRCQQRDYYFRNRNPPTSDRNFLRPLFMTIKILISKIKRLQSSERSTASAVGINDLSTALELCICPTRPNSAFRNILPTSPLSVPPNSDLRQSLAFPLLRCTIISIVLLLLQALVLLALVELLLLWHVAWGVLSSPANSFKDVMQENM